MERLSDYDYFLPEELIAQTPLVDRSASRLLRLHPSGAIEHLMFQDVSKMLEPGDLLVMNDTRVSAVRLFGAKATGANVEALLLRELQYGRYEALVKPGKRLQKGTRIDFAGSLKATIIDDVGDGLKVLEFDAVDDLPNRLESTGSVPLPPYIRELLQDKERYQTVYGASNGSAAAPTAGLHFTPEILDDLSCRGVEIAKVTLHVGIDTFRPVLVEDLDQHRMHGEKCIVPAETATKIQHTRGRIIAVGTTTVRTLESFAVGRRCVEPGMKDSKLFIRPGFEFKIVDGMFTNFHLPRTTMLLMISALVGKHNVSHAYEEAVKERYRFLSFGDSMLIL